MARNDDCQARAAGTSTLSRFVRNAVCTWRFRCEVHTLRALHRAFAQAPAQCSRQRDVHRRTVSVQVAAADKQQRILALQQRVVAASASARTHCDASRDKDNDTSGDPALADESDWSSGSESCVEERVSVETVVHKLFLQVEDAKQQVAIRDARILELEARVAELTALTSDLRRGLEREQMQVWSEDGDHHALEGPGRSEKRSNQLAVR